MIQELLSKLESMLEKPKQVLLLKDTLKNEGYSEELIDDAVHFLINYNHVTITEDGPTLNEKTIRFQKKVDVKFNAPEPVSFEIEPLFVVSLPAFNRFSLENRFSEDKIPHQQLTDVIRTIFTEATNEIWICSPFIDFRGISHFLQLLETKLLKGVRLLVLTRPSQDFEMKKFKSFLENRGLLDQLEHRTYHFSKDRRVLSGIHAKLVGADHSAGYLGSGEIRENSFTRNLEVGVLFRGGLADLLRNVFDSIYSLAEEEE